mgnify:FL=1
MVGNITIGSVFKDERSSSAIPTTKKNRIKNKKILNLAKQNPNTEYVVDMRIDNDRNWAELDFEVEQYRALAPMGFRFRATYEEGQEGFVYLLVKYVDNGMSHEEEQ